MYSKITNKFIERTNKYENQNSFTMHEIIQKTLVLRNSSYGLLLSCLTLVVVC